MDYSVCVPAVLGKKSIPEALRAVRRAGFHRYEIWGWWDMDLDACLAVQKEEGLSIAALCTRFITLTDPAYQAAYLKGLSETADVCRKLDCKTVISQVGQAIEGVPREVQHDSIVAGLKKCLPLLRKEDLTLVIEPLNTKVDHPGYFLWEAAEAFEIIREVGDPHVKVLYDLYHQAVMDDLDGKEMTDNMDKIGHFHLAGCPGRHEPLTGGGVDYTQVLEAIRTSGYSGSVGLEYFPAGDPEQSLKEIFNKVNL